MKNVVLTVSQFICGIHYLYLIIKYCTLKLTSLDKNTFSYIHQHLHPLNGTYSVDMCHHNKLYVVLHKNYISVLLFVHGKDETICFMILQSAV